MGQAFAEYIQRYPTNRLPKAGGLTATVVVLLDYDSLLGGLKAAQLDTGEHLSPGAARRLACEAGIIPAVLGGESQVLDLGRKTRFHTEAQRIAKTVEVGGCEVDGCDRPPGACHLHHPVRWVDGGRTDRDGIMICPWHHARAHDTRYQMDQASHRQIHLQPTQLSRSQPHPERAPLRTPVVPERSRSWRR